MGLWAVSGLAMVLGLGAPAFAQDFDDLEDFEFEEPPEEEKEEDGEEAGEEDEAPLPEETEPPPIEQEEIDILDSEFEDEEDEGVDLLDDDAEVKPEGDDDTEAMYRARIREVEDLAPDDAIQQWQAYLEQFPKSLYRRDIEERIDRLFDELYAVGTPRGPDDEDGGDDVDAMRQEIEFSQGLLLDNINPRSRLQGGFAFGAPIYIDAVLDYEHGFSRRVSLHGGLRTRYGVFGVEFGPRFALVKSTRAQTLVTLSIDARVNGNPLYPTFRPILGIGKKFGSVQVQIQGGAELDIRDVGGTELQARYTGGAQVQWAANDRVAVFAETLLLFKPQPRDGAFEGGLFSFNVASVGLTFYPQISSTDPDARDLEVKVGGSLPVAQSYYSFYLGSINAQFNYLL